MSEVLVLDRVRLERHRQVVIEDFSLRLASGDFVALIGANGAGKTTILRLIMGFLKPCSGSITLFGTPVSSSPSVRKRIGYVPQALHIDFRMPITAGDIVSMGRYGRSGLLKRLTDEDRRIIDSALADVGIEHLRNRPAGHLSGGEYQKVQIARALCQTPELLILDEPTGNLDMGAERECLELIVRLHETYGFTTIIVMHDLGSLPDACNRAVIVDGGRKYYDGNFPGIFTEEHLPHIYKNRSHHILRSLIDELASKGGIE